MRFLLVCANQLKHPWPVIPFGACCVAEAALAAGHATQVLDLMFVRDCARVIADAIAAFKPDVVGVSIRNIDNCYGFKVLPFITETRDKVIDPIKKTFTGPIIIGGPAVGINPAEMLAFFDLEYAAIGDGEKVMVDFLAAVAAMEDPAGSTGLLVRRNDSFLAPRGPCRIANLDDFPMPRIHELIDLKTYRKYDAHLQVQTKRGCALACCYCTYNRIEGRTYRLRDPQAVADHVALVAAATGIDHFEFTDSTFNIPLDHAKKVLRAIIAKKMKLRLRTMGLNPAAVDEELADLLREAGFMEVDLGVDAVSDTALKGLGKNFTVPDILRATALLRSRRIPLNWFLLLGAPGETEETVRQTLAAVAHHLGRWNFATTGIGLRVYNGAPIAEHLLMENPGCSPDRFLTPVTYEPPGISLEKIDVLTALAATRRPNILRFSPEEAGPLWLVRLGAILAKIFMPRQPLWRAKIALNYLPIITGVNLLRRMALRKKLREMDSQKVRWTPENR